MQLRVVDVFAEGRYRGNPAAVVLLRDGFDETAAMQSRASELALPTTVFLTHQGPARYGVRWFTPRKELDICGHGTMAAAAFVQDVLGEPDGDVRFESAQHVLVTRRQGAMTRVDLPKTPSHPCPAPPGLEAALGRRVVDCRRTPGLVVAVLAAEADVAGLVPDFATLARIDCRGHIVTAASTQPGVDFVSRAFFPALGVDEDHVCVSAHRVIGPYWSLKTGRSSLSAVQSSARGGKLRVDVHADRVSVSGLAHVRPDALAGR